MSPNVVWRLFGLLFLAVAVGAALWGIWLPYQEALAQAPRVYYKIGTFVLVPFAAVFGLFFVIFGNSIAYRDAERRKATPAGLVVMVLAVVSSGVLFWWFNALTELGYPYPGAERMEKQMILPIPAGTPAPMDRPTFGR